MADDIGALVDAAEHDLARTVAAVLAEVATEFAQELSFADEIVAARFSVSRIARMFTDRMPRIVRRLLRVSEEAAHTAAGSVDAELPSDWEDLPERYDDGTLPEPFRAYVETTEHLLRAVGDRLSDVATAELSEGVAAGETIDQLRARLRDAFDRAGAQLGDVREERIARTEAGRAWNTATLAAARQVTGPDRPIVKQWITRRDPRVRESHADVNGQIRLVDEPFTVAGIDMDCPHDPAAPAALVVNCRCVLALYPEIASAAFDSQPGVPARICDSQEPPVSTAVRPALSAAADGSHTTGAMIALIPTDEDAQRLAVDGGEDPGELHLTLYFLGKGADWTTGQRDELIESVRAAAADLTDPVQAHAFGAAHWNANSDEPSWVWSVGDDRDRPDDAPALTDAHQVAATALEGIHGPELPVQHSPWVPHVCAAYSDDPGLLAALVERLGTVTFDRIRLAFAGDHTDIPLVPEEDTPMEEETAAALDTRTWSTPDDTALAFENQETGDGRIFAAGALYWEAGPWPLQYADEMLMGHEGAELAGAIDSVGRDGDRITGAGVLYPGRPAGADACTLLDEGAPLGISVDLDSVDLEFVDRTVSDGDDEDDWWFAASLPSLSLIRLEDGAWMLSVRTVDDWSASGVALTRTGRSVQLITGADGRVSREAVQQAFAGTGLLTAAAGDADDPDAVVVHSEQAGDFLLRITRARLRGATLVAMPAYDRARIVIDPADGTQDATAAAAVVAAATVEPHERVVTYVSSSPLPVGPREVADALGMRMDVAHGHLVRAAQSGRIVRLGRGQYRGASTLPEGLTVTAAGTEELNELEASAWTAMRDTAPMPAAWFREPTPAELPPGSGGVHYAGGRVFGWVAQAGEPHAGHPGRNLTIDGLGKIDLTHFLRARFKLDNGKLVRAGAFTMNAPHHRDGAECESAACQFDDTRTVAGIVTVGMSKGGMWFSGAAAPWLSEWDRQVFAACQPSYHMTKGAGGRWQLRAVLSVPVPGHSSPLVATAVAERSNLALAASAALGLTSPDTVSGQPDIVSGQDADTLSPAVGSPVDHVSLVDSFTAALNADPSLVDVLAAAMERRDAQRRAEADALTAAVNGSTEPKGAR